MTVVNAVIVPPQFVTSSEVTIYDADDRTLLDRFTVHNSDGSKVKLTVYLTDGAEATGLNNRIFEDDIDPSNTYSLTELEGHVMAVNDTIVVIAATTNVLSIRGSARIVT